MPSAAEAAGATVTRPRAAEEPAASVVIPTLGRETLDRTVDALARQTHDRFEVVVVRAPDLSVTEARELGVERARSEFVLCTDDDCVPDARWVEALLGRLRGEGVVCVEGRVIGHLEYDGVREYVGCNLAYRADAFEAIGGYDHRLAGWRADSDLGLRLETVGECVYEHDAVVDHPEPTGSTYDPGKEALFRSKHPDAYDELFVPDTVLGRVNDWLWRRGVWDYVDRVRGT